MNTQEMNRESYEGVCKELPKKSKNDGNHPSDFDTLSEPEKAALLYWIQHAIGFSASFDKDHSSYGIKHDFEREGFYVTNGQFKGAMLLSGYNPKDIHDLNWIFPIKRRYARRCLVDSYDYADYQRRYSLAGFDKEFAKLLIEAGYLGKRND